MLFVLSKCKYNCIKVHKLFALLNLSHAYVTSLGRLVGVVALTEVRVSSFIQCCVQFGVCQSDIRVANSNVTLI